MEGYAKDFETVWAAMDRTEKLLAENGRQFEAYKKQMAKSSKKVDKLFAKTREQIDKTSKKVEELTASIEATRKEVGGIGDSYGMHAESYFYESLKNGMKFGGISFDLVEDDVKKSFKLPNGERLNAQFDIVMINCDTIAIIEVKSKVQKKDVWELVNRKLENYKTIHKHYANFKFYLGVAGFAYDKNAEESALENGVGMLKLCGENVEIEDKHLRVY